MKLAIVVKSSMTPEDEIKILDQMINDRDALIRTIEEFFRIAPSHPALRWTDMLELGALTPEQQRLLKNILED